MIKGVPKITSLFFWRKKINAELFEHIDGLRSYYKNLKDNNDSSEEEST
jgi:hypothetical protein